MKAKIILSVMLGIALFTACSNEENLEPTGEKKPVSISLKVDNPKSRASIDTSTSDEDSKINDLTVFVFRNNGELDATPVYVDAATLNSTGIPTINGTTLAKSIYVISNTGSFTSGAFKNVQQLSDLQQIAMQLDKNPNTGSNCISQNVWMSGSTTSLLPNGTSANGVEQKKANVQLYFVPAKVYVIVKNQMSYYSATGNTLLDGATVVNGGSWTRFTVEGTPQDYRPSRAELTTATKTPFYYNGVDINPSHYADAPDAYNGKPDYATNAIYNYTSSEFAKTTNFEAVPNAEQGFYIFPGITNNSTYLSVYGRFSPLGANDASAVPYYWSVAFNGSDGILSSLDSGKKYIVTITLKGNANTGGGGDEDPTREVTDVNIDVTVQVAHWDVVIEAEKVIN